MAPRSPTVRQRELGRRLRELRARHRLTVEDVADKLLCSATKISRLETGTRRPSLRDVRDLCGIYGVGEAASAELMELARGAREQAWWARYPGLDLDPYLGLEAEAAAITSFTAYYLPALLQTEEYARAVITAIAPAMDPAACRQRVEVQMRRQHLLDHEERPRYRVFLDEAVLRRPVGSPQVMAAQLGRVLAAERAGKAAVYVIPFSAGPHAAQDSNFVLLEFGEEPGIPPVVFVEGLTGNRYLEREADVARYREAIGYLQRAALSRQDSVRYISELKSKSLFLSRTGSGAPCRSGGE